MGRIEGSEPTDPFIFSVLQSLTLTASAGSNVMGTDITWERNVQRMDITSERNVHGTDISSERTPRASHPSFLKVNPQEKYQCRASSWVMGGSEVCSGKA